MMRWWLDLIHLYADEEYLGVVRVYMACETIMEYSAGFMILSVTTYYWFMAWAEFEAFNPDFHSDPEVGSGPSSGTLC
eukprot:TRINITY_DN5301_c0_g1_i1.p1 TRINITY_DN5301_c0_g1~~TRINITY_DN5301_c0_g1_i1.p1  ORF type:complete len:78 (-),score=10.43 TRINITY_DN5301_c0_g1_i1:139-372(-)